MSVSKSHYQYTKSFATAVPAASATYRWDLPGGMYRMALQVNAVFTDGGTTKVKLYPYIKSDKSAVSTDPLGMATGADTVIVTGITFANGANTEQIYILPGETAALGPVVPLPYGAKLSLTIGAATSGDTLTIDGVAYPVD